MPFRGLELGHIRIQFFCLSKKSVFYSDFSDFCLAKNSENIAAVGLASQRAKSIFLQGLCFV